MCLCGCRPPRANTALFALLTKCGLWTQFGVPNRGLYLFFWLCWCAHMFQYIFIAFRAFSHFRFLSDQQPQLSLQWWVASKLHTAGQKIADSQISSLLTARKALQMHPFVILTAYIWRVRWKLESIPAGFIRTTHIHIHYQQFREASWSNLHVFGMGKKTRATGSLVWQVQMYNFLAVRWQC